MAMVKQMGAVSPWACGVNTNDSGSRRRTSSRSSDGAKALQAMNHAGLDFLPLAALGPMGKRCGVCTRTIKPRHSCSREKWGHHLHRGGRGIDFDDVFKAHGPQLNAKPNPRHWSEASRGDQTCASFIGTHHVSVRIFIGNPF